MSERKVLFPSESMFPYVLPYIPLAQSNNQAATATCSGIENLSNENLDFDFWGFWDSEASRASVYSYLPRELEKDAKNVQVLFDGILSLFQELTPQWRHSVNQEILRLKLPKRYIGVHFRRGDKLVETPYLSISTYQKAVLEVAEQTGNDNVYLASDSPEAPELLGLSGFGLNVFFDVQEKRYDNANHRFLAQHQELANDETLTALKTIEILSAAEQVVGQDNAHFATIAAGRIAAINGTDQFGILLDGKMRLKEPRIALFYGVKRRVRAVGKALLPMFSMRSKRGI